ncbi:MAG TPA: VOC family protein [Steroidobacteraceae bacterium]|jgi:glyoxylase I family protein
MSAEAARPRFLAVDHVSWTVPDLDAAIAFYTEAFGATVLYRIGPIDAADLPKDANGRDWMETHVGVRGARLTLAMLQLAPNLKFQMVQYDKPDGRRQDVPRNCDRGGHHIAMLVEDVEAAAKWLAQRGCKVLEIIAMDSGPLAGKKNVYVQDPWGHQLELVD